MPNKPATVHVELFTPYWAQPVSSEDNLPKYIWATQNASLNPTQELSIQEEAHSVTFQSVYMCTYFLPFTYFLILSSYVSHYAFCIPTQNKTNKVFFFKSSGFNSAR